MRLEGMIVSRIVRSSEISGIGVVLSRDKHAT